MASPPHLPPAKHAADDQSQLQWLFALKHKVMARNARETAPFTDLVAASACLRAMRPVLVVVMCVTWPVALLVPQIARWRQGLRRWHPKMKT